MRQKRAKAYRKLMHSYCMAFGFRQPYQVLVDSEICRTTIDQKFDLIKQLGIVLQGEVKPMITQCCIHELYLQGRPSQPAVDLAKTFERRKCNHREVVPGDHCILSVVGEKNQHRYVVASQSQTLRSQLRKVPAVPMVHINRSVMVMEPPSDVTLQAKVRLENAALDSKSALDAAVIASTKPAEEKALKKRKGPIGPNPLSVKKKSLPLQKKQQSNTCGGVKRKYEPEEKQDVSSTKKRKRRRNGGLETVLDSAEKGSLQSKI